MQNDLAKSELVSMTGMLEQSSGQNNPYPRGGVGGLITRLYALKVQVCPPRDQIPVLGADHTHSC